MVPESTFNQNILVRPKLLFARTRINRKNSLGDILGELESSKHEIFTAPILEEEDNSETSTSTLPSSSSSSSSSSLIDDPFMTKRVDRSNRFRSKQQRQRFRFGNKSRRRQSQDDEEDEEIAQPTEIDEVDEVKEVRRPIRIRQRNLHHRHHRHEQHNSKYKSYPSRSGHHRSSRGSRGYKKVKSKVDEDDEDSSEASASTSYTPSDPNDSREEEKDDEITTTTATATTTNPSKSQSDRFTSSPDGQDNSALIPNLLPKSYETYSPDSTSAISSFVSRIRDDIKKGKEGMSKVKLNQQQSQLPWIPETDDLTDDEFNLKNHQNQEQVTRREENSDKVKGNNQRKSSYKINSRPNVKSTLMTDSSMVNSPGGINDQMMTMKDASSVDELKKLNDSTSSASTFNAIHLHFNNHLPPLMSDKITERLYSRGLLVYLKDFKYGGL